MTTLLSIIRYITDECWLRICVGISSSSSSYHDTNTNTNNNNNNNNNNSIVSIILKDGSSAYLLELCLDVILIFASYKISSILILIYHNVDDDENDDDDDILRDNNNNNNKEQQQQQQQLDYDITTSNSTNNNTTTGSMINLEYAIIYFSIINSWYLFIHHYSSRFVITQQQQQLDEEDENNSINNTRLHSILLCLYIFGMIWSVQSLTDFSSSNNTTNNSNNFEQQFSFSMVVIRFAMFILIFRIGCYVPRATATCALMSFFLSDSGLCYGLATLTNSSNNNNNINNNNNNESSDDAKLFLWGFSCWMELLVDFFIAVSLSENLQLSYNLIYTLNHFANVILLAPLCSFTMQLILRTTASSTFVNWIYVIESWMLLLLFGLLFYSLKGTVYETALLQTKIYQSFLFVILKILGLSIWTVTSYLILILLPLPPKNDDDNDDNDNRNNNMMIVSSNNNNYYCYYHHLLGGSIGNVLIWFFVFRLFGRRQHIFQDVLWIVTCCSIKILSTYSNNNKGNDISTTTSSTENNNTNDIYLSIYIILVGILNISESWTSLRRSRTVAATTTTTTTTPTTTTTTTATNNNERGEDEAGERTRLLQPP